MIINIFNVGDGEWLAQASMNRGSLEIEGPGAAHIHSILSKMQTRRGLTDEEIFEQLPKIFKTLMMAIPDGQETEYGFRVPERGE